MEEKDNLNEEATVTEEIENPTGKSEDASSEDKGFKTAKIVGIVVTVIGVIVSFLRAKGILNISEHTPDWIMIAGVVLYWSARQAQIRKHLNDEE